jgi:outer membrane biosynthesis protein TonB
VRIKSSDIKDSQLSTCVQAAIRLWKFPAPKGGSVTITYPFVFQTM